MISVIIITKNEEQVIGRLLNSIKEQDIEYEIIVSDAQSTDKTRQIAESYHCRVVNGGLPSKGRNEGAKYAKYNLLLFLDADVVLPPGFLKGIIKEINECGLDCGTTLYKPISNKLIIKIIYVLYNWYALLLEKISPHAGGFCIFIKKELFKKINGFNEKMLLCEDHDLVKRASKFGKFDTIKSIYINCDVRRIEKEGVFSIIYRYIKAESYRLTMGDSEKPVFGYKLHGCEKDVQQIYEDNKPNT